MIIQALVFLLLLWFGSALATIREVPLQYPTILSAINIAEDYDTILVAPGIYSEQLNIRRPLTLASHFLIVPDTSFVQFTCLELPPQLFFTDMGSVIIVDNATQFRCIGFTIRNGSGSVFWISSTNWRRAGGAILADSTRVEIRNCYLYRNAAGNGGGIYSYGGSLFLYQTTIDSCMTTNIPTSFGPSGSGEGGGLVFLYGDTILIEQSRFVKNYAGGWFGGAGSISRGNYAAIIQSSIIRNGSGRFVGGFYLHDVDLVENCIFEQNYAPDYGAIYYNELDTTVTKRINRCIFSQNTSLLPGPNNLRMYAALYIGGYHGRRWGIDECQFIENESVRGTIGVQSAHVSITNSQFVRNEVELHGSVILLRNSSVLRFEYNYVFENRGLNVFYPYSYSNVYAHYNDFYRNGAVTRDTPINSLVDARLNYWGHPTGPIEWMNNSNPLGQGDSVYHTTLYQPFLTEPVFPMLNIGKENHDQQKLPQFLNLEEVYPNPTNASICVRFFVKQAAPVTIIITDILGREVYREQIPQVMSGSNSKIIPMEKYPSGVYIVQVQYQTEVKKKKFVLLK